MPAAMIKTVTRQDGVKHQVYARRNKRKVYVGTYDSKRIAEEAYEDFCADSRKIKRGELPTELDQKKVLRVAAEDWLVDLERNQSRSADTYRRFLEQQVYPWLGNHQIASIRKADVKKWRSTCGQKYSAATVNAAMATLSGAFSWFVKERGWVAANPCTGIDRLKEKDERLYNWIRTVPEIERLLRVSKGELRDIFAVALGTGMRIDEILHLQWVDVDLERRLLTVQRGRKGTTKSGKMRHVPILDSVLPVLRERRLKRGDAVLVFPSPTKFGARNRPVGRVRAKRPVHRGLKDALARAELDTAIRVHDLRHTFASHWVMNGGDIFRLSRVLGHASVQMTERVYAHLSPTAWAQDYDRVTFRLPHDAQVITFPVRVDVG